MGFLCPSERNEHICMFKTKQLGICGNLKLQYHIILQYLDINIDICLGNGTMAQRLTL